MKTLFMPVLDELQELLDVSKPGDLPKAITALQIRNAIYLDALSESEDCVEAVRRAIEKFKEVKNGRL